jgi:hypothetical protein
VDTDKISRENYEVEDFISDESFINYHLKSNQDDCMFWENWLINNPGKQALAEAAKEIIEALSITISEKDFRQEFEKLKELINKNKKEI